MFSLRQVQRGQPHTWLGRRDGVRAAGPLILLRPLVGEAVYLEGAVCRPLELGVLLVAAASLEVTEDRLQGEGRGRYDGADHVGEDESEEVERRVLVNLYLLQPVLAPIWLKSSGSFACSPGWHTFSSQHRQMVKPCSQKGRPSTTQELHLQR